MEPRQLTGSELAIIAMDGLFPNCKNLDDWWAKLRSGTELISHFSEEELLAHGVDPELLSHPNYVKSGGPLLRDLASFDASFFGYTPREAEAMDPQQRLFLEYCHNV